MADKGTLHELKVSIRMALSGYKKDMESVKSATKKMSGAVDAEMAKVRQALGKVDTAKSQKEIEKLTSSLEKQKEKIALQENALQSMKNKYNDLISGITEDKGTMGLEKQLKSAKKEFAEAESKMQSLLDKYEMYEAAAAAGGTSAPLKEVSAELDKLDPQYEALGRKVEQLREQLEQVKMNPESSASAQEMAAKIEAETAKLERLKNEAGTTKEKLDALMSSKSPPETSSKLNQIISSIKNLASTATSSAKTTEKGFSQIGAAVDKVKNRISRLVQTVLVFNLLRTAITNFRSYLGDCLNANEEFSNSLNVIKTNLQTAFAAIYSAALPAINALMSALATLSTALASLISSIFGKTYSESLQVAKGLNSAASAASSASSASGQTFSFDEVHNIEDGSSDDTSSGLADTTAQLAESEGLLAKIKSALATFFDPIKEAWDSKGASVMASARVALSNLKALASDVGQSFAGVWANGTGVETCSRILEILRSILETIGNIAAGLDEAWNFNGTGTQIVQDLFNILNNVLGVIERCAQATSDWSAGVDFTPILTAFEGLLSSVDSISSTVGDSLVWLYESVLLPLAGWTIEDAVPAFFDLLSAALDLVNAALEVFQPYGEWLWNSFLQPIASWTGGVICTVLETLAGLLTTIGNWIVSHQAAVKVLGTIIGSVATAVGLVNTAITLWNTVGAIAAVVTTALGTAMTVLTSPITLVTLAIAACIAAGVLLYQNWDTVSAKASSAWSSIWSTIKGVINSILGGIESLANGVVNGINTMINALNSLSFDVPDWVPEIGGKTFGFNLSTVGTVSLPRLAKGGIVSSATPLIAGEAGSEAIVPLENNTEWIETLASRIADILRNAQEDTGDGDGEGETSVSVPITLDIDGYALLKKLIRIYKRRGYPIEVEVT